MALKNIIDGLLLPRSLLLLAILLNIFLTSFSAPTESETLIKFKDSLSNNAALSGWDATKPPCPNGNWVGIICSNDKVWGLKLQNMGLKGKLNMEILKDLPHLRTMSIMGNEFEGDFPNLKLVTALKSVYLSDNKFAGEIKADMFDGMNALKKLHAARNQLTGSIPASLTKLPLLIELMLEQNRLTGEIPNFPQERLKMLNVSFNELEGQVPQVLTKLDPTSYMGNEDLCGGALPACSADPVKRLPIGTIVISVIAAVAALIAIVAAFIILRSRKKTSEPEDPNLVGSAQVHKRAASVEHLDKLEQGMSPAASSSSSSSSTVKNNNQQNSAKLTFLRDDRERFDLADLLKASAEILGSGVFGCTYKAALGTGGPVMVVKRYRQMNNVGKEEFQEHMRRLGRLRHANLLPLVAFYYRKEEKLLVTDHIDNASLAVYLHGNRGRRLPVLDWQKRLRIVKGIARGLLYLYNELPSITAPHGHLKSANVILNDSWEPVLTDYALSPIVNPEHAKELMTAYKSPEYKQQGRITKKTDVWSLGILILEIMTGKYPTNNAQQGKGNETDLLNWVQTIQRENWMTEVFDKDMGGAKNKLEEEEMVKLLDIGLSCCEMDVEKRWEMKEVVERIEQLRENEGEKTS